MNQKLRINEIFYSLQGEGAFSGYPAIFIRLSGCNLSCPFCDTKHQSYKEYPISEILEHIQHMPAHRIIFTGGEPSLQLSAQTLHPFKEQGYELHVETNGTGNLPLEELDWITCSPKTAYDSRATLRQEGINEMKVIFDDEHDVDQFLNIKADCYYLQPCDTGEEERNKEITRKCIEHVKEEPRWNLSLQIHKILNIQ